MQKLILNLCIIGILVGINAIVISSYFDYYSRLNDSRTILDEIAHIDINNHMQSQYQQDQGLKGDYRTAHLQNFFRKYNSDLYDYAGYIVETSDKYDIDYRLIPAIGMQESNLCKKIPANSYNCWGWGIYGDTVTRFDSYEEAIDTIARGLKTEYIDKGLVEPEDIMRKYTPSSPGTWARAVNYFFDVIE